MSRSTSAGRSGAAGSLVGCHWFQYVHEPLTGRSYDGENYNIGFLTVTDTPYPELVAAARKIHREAYARRFHADPDRGSARRVAWRADEPG